MKKWLGLVLAAVLLIGCGGKAGNEESLDTQDAAMQTGEEGNMQEDAGTAEMPDVQIDFEEKKVHIPELEKDYEIWFLADSHIIVQDGSEDEQTASYATERSMGFVNELGVTSDLIFSKFIDEANEKKPDMILFGGDIIDFPSDANVAFIQKELSRLEVPYIMTMGNHDWTFPWEYMTEQGKSMYRPMLEDNMGGNTYYSIVEMPDLVFLSVDDSSNQIAAEALEGVEQAYAMNKPIVLLQHVPFSTEELIARAKQDWGNPVTLGMQVHGGIAPNDVSKNLWDKTHEESSLIKAVLAGHVHFAYEEALSESTVEIITDAAFKGKATKIFLQKNKEHQYFCDKFTLTVDDKQFDLTQVDPELSSVSELYPIAGEQLYILGRVDETNNSMMIYDFTKEEFVFVGHGTTMCWVQDKFETVRYLKDNVVYDLEGNIIYKPDESNRISMIEYVVEDFKVTVTDENHENMQEIWIE